jgi:SAM-dependent methyltransferase
MTTPIARYSELLFAHLDDREPAEVDFFINDRRFDVMRRTLGDGLAGKSVLNLACGPFAMEFFVAPKCARMDCVDIDASLAPLHAELVAERLIAPSSFTLSDVMTFEPVEQYDAIIINDVFYTKFVDFHAVIARYIPYLKPGGQLYFDILDRRAGHIWKLFDKDSRYRRYDMAEVRHALAAHNLAVEATVPSLGIKGGFDHLLRSGLWAGAGIANNFIFLARKLGATLAMAALLFFGGEAMSPSYDDRRGLHVVAIG